MSSQIQAQDRVLDIAEHISPRGIKFWHVEDKSLPIIAMHFAFKGAGSINDPMGKIGLGQLVSNTIDEGAAERDANAFQEALQDHAIDLSFGNNRDNFTGKIKTLKRHSDLAFELLRDAIHVPRFDGEAVNRMRQANIMRVKSSLAKPDWLAARLMNDVYFGDHPYALNSGGTISGLNAITADDMRQFVTRNFVRETLRIATAGDMSADDMGEVIDNVFADLPLGEPAPTFDEVVPPTQSIKKAFKTNSPQSVVLMTWPTFTKDDPDYYALRVMNHLLGGGGFSSYLMDEIREKKGLTYGIYSNPDFMDYSNMIMIQSAMEPQNIAAMTSAIETILNDMKANPTDENLLNDAKNYLMGSLPLRFSTTLSLSGAAIRMQLDGRPIDALDQWNNNIMAVDVDDVMRVANRVFTSVNPTVTIIAGAIPDDGEFELVEELNGIK